LGVLDNPLNGNTETSSQKKNYKPSYREVSKIRKIHKSHEEKKINLNLTELKYVGADNDGMKKPQKKKKQILKFCQ